MDNFNSISHPKTDVKKERLNKIMEDMLWVFILHVKGSWRDHLPFVEFSYNNYQSSIYMAPFKVYYG